MYTARALWAAALATFVAGDAATTHVGVALGASEAHPLSDVVLSLGGTPAMLLVKLAAVAGLYCLYRASPRDWRVGVPLGLALLGSAVVGWNAAVVLMLA